jgi:hypothetical protein
MGKAARPHKARQGAALRRAFSVVSGARARLPGLVTRPLIGPLEENGFA